MKLQPEDIQISTFNSGSAWIPNTSGIELKHTPSGIVVRCSEERSQHANKAKAYKELEAKVTAWKPSKESFDNSTIRERTPNKPHIAFVGGYWRVSTWKRGTGDLYYKAHAFIRRLNNR